MKNKLEQSNKLYKFSFDDLSDTRRIFWEEMWFWPPLIVNDIMGYLNIGSDHGGCLTGDIFLKRKYFHRNSYHRAYRKTTLKKNEFLYYPTRIYHYHVILNNNDSYIKATLGIIEEARDLIQKRFKKANIWLPGYELTCLNLAEADRQLRERGLGSW